MSTLPTVDAQPFSPARDAQLPVAGRLPPWFVWAGSLAALAGVSAVWPTAMYLWTLWTTDALKSIGMLIPIASAALILRAWRRLGWERDGTWWGLILLLLTVLAVHLREQAVLVFVVSPQWSVFIPPHSLVAFAYAAGVVLLLGGTRLFRASLFPLLLLWFVNPVPHIFNVFVDLPLQRISAHVARAFAMALGQPLTPDQMRLMFTPEFGMFIAPGCNGIRGAVTMGFVALMVGYLYRFRAPVLAGFVAAAVLLGYVFNFLRLCVLVLYYIVALKFTSLQDRAEMGDYIIGATLFLFGTGLLFLVVGRVAGSSWQRSEPEISVPPPSRASAASGVLPLRLAALFLLALFGGVRLSHAMLRARAQTASLPLPPPWGSSPRRLAPTRWRAAGTSTSRPVR